jgi:hypothetical protein
MYNLVKRNYQGEAMKRLHSLIKFALPVMLAGALQTGCAWRGDVYHDPNMDFGSIKTVAVMPILNLSKDQQGADRVRDVLITAVLASREMYPLPVGEVIKGISVAGVAYPFSPSPEEAIKLGKQMKVDAVITGVLREYGEVRAGSTSSDVISLSLQMLEVQTGRVVWSASSTKGGISISDRMFGGGGVPLNDITEKAVNDLVTKMLE